jgi:hypothetical protein|tara:strand:- start:606 stop:1064 length:459 start_codon:yes stop_codon:yes gene_type:complete
MKITENQLKQVIDEEIQAMIESGEIDEGVLDRLKARAAGVKSKVGSAVGAAKQTLGSKVSGVKAAAVGALGGDAADLKQQQAAQQQAAAATKAAGARKAGGQKAASILNAHLKSLVNDLTKLGVTLERQDVKAAIQALQTAVNAATAQAAEE